MTQIDAEDPDGDTIILILARDDFEEFILQETGRLSFLAPPDFESRNLYDSVVITSDTKLSSLLNLEINILNKNDNPPEFKSPTEFFTPHLLPLGKTVKTNQRKEK